MSPYNKKFNETKKFFGEFLKYQIVELGEGTCKLTPQCFIVQNHKVEIKQNHNKT